MRLFSVVLKDIKATKLRSVLTCLSMLVGVLAVVGVSAAAAITEEIFIAQSEQETGRIASYSFDFPMTNGTSTALRVYRELESRIGPQPVGLAITAQHSGIVTNQSGFAKEFITMSWTEGDLNSVRRLPLIAGVIPTVRDAYPPWVILNQVAAADLDLIVGDTMRVAPNEAARGVAFTVAAIIADGGRDERHAYAPMRQATLWPGALTGESAHVLLSIPVSAESQLKQMLAAAMTQLGIEQQEINRIDRARNLQEMLQVVQAIFLGCGALALGISALGILNIGLASINERSRELVIRRAIGARKRDILAQILGSAVLIGIAASAVAIGIAAIALTTVVPAFVPAGSPVRTPSFPWVACAWGIIAAIITSLIGASIPAHKASKLPVAQAIRA